MGTDELVFHEARRMLDAQREDLRDVRARAARLFAAAGVINGLFGIRSLGAAPATLRIALVVAALAGFIAMAVLVVVIELPRKVTFDEQLGAWIDAVLADEGRRPLDFYAHFAKQYNGFRYANKKVINGKFTMLTAICILLAVQVACWALSLI